MCGYVFKTRIYLHNECDEYAKTISVMKPSPYPNTRCILSSFTLMKDTGGLLYPTLELFQSFKEIESVQTMFFFK